MVPGAGDAVRDGDELARRARHGALGMPMPLSGGCGCGVGVAEQSGSGAVSQATQPTCASGRAAREIGNANAHVVSR